MGMNFKIYNNASIASNYVGDIIRKQVHNNPTSVLVFDKSQSLDLAIKDFVADAKVRPADFSQIYIASINNDLDLSPLKQLDIPNNQLKIEDSNSNIKKVLEDRKRVDLAVLSLGANGKIGYLDSSNDELFDAREIFIVAIGRDKAQAVRDLYNAKENDENDFSKIKKHRMVTIVLDREAASELDKDIVEYYSYKYA